MERKDFEFELINKSCSTFFQPARYGLSYKNKYQMFHVSGRVNEEKNWFAEDGLSKLIFALTPIDDAQAWDDALVYGIKLIPVNGAEEDKIRIDKAGTTWPVKIKAAMKIENPSPKLERALLGILEADKVIREAFPGYCLTKAESNNDG